jgi:hypothetical protein
LRRTALAPFAAAHAPPPIRIRFLDWCLEPQFEQAQHMTIDDPRRDRAKQLGVRDRVEVFRQVGVHHIGEPMA